MSTTWNTKWGVRRVRVELPTLEEALEAAADLSTVAAQQIEIAAALMDQPVAAVKADAERILRERARRLPSVRRPGSRQTVIVERNNRRRILVR